MDELLPSGKLYTHVLLEKWTEILGLSEQFRTNLLLNNSDHEATFNYIARLTNLWGELYPKLTGRHDISDLVQEFERYSQYYFDPSQLIAPDKSEEIFKLQAILRRALEALRITRYED